MNAMQRATLKRVWLAVFGREPSIEDTGCDPEGFGNEFSVEGIALWPTQEDIRPMPSIVNLDPEPVPTRVWVVADYKAIHNYPHAPDDVDLVNESFHARWAAVVAELVSRAAENAANAEFERMADEEYEAEMAQWRAAHPEVPW
jgi:hypothetical protein